MAKLAEEERARQREVGERIAASREELRLTQPVVAERVGVSLRAYQNWEAGHTRIAWPNLERLSGILHVPADQILNGTPDAEPELTILPTHLNEIMDAFEDRLASLEDGQAEILGLLRQLAKTELEAELSKGPPSTRQQASGTGETTRRRRGSGPGR